MRTYGTVISVLYVEDDAAAAMVARAALESRGYQYHHAADAFEALRTILTNQIDILLLDIGLPEINGLTFLRMIRELGVTSTVIIISAQGTAQNAELAAKYGVDRFLVKPLGPRQLIDEVADAVPTTDRPYNLLSDPTVVNRGDGPTVPPDPS